MSCTSDVHQAILDKVYDEFARGRNTFSRPTLDTIQINAAQDNSKSKAASRGQARAIAKSLANSIERSFNGYVRATIIDAEGTAIRVKILVDPNYINHELENLQNKQRAYVLNDTGPNTNAQLLPAVVVNKGRFENFVQFKLSQLDTYRNRLADIRKKQKDTNITTTELVKLKRMESQFENLIDGNKALNIVGLEKEIEDLIKAANRDAVRPAIEKDLKRIHELTFSDNIEDIDEAASLVQFYDLIGSFGSNMTVNGNPVQNPLFAPDEIFLLDANGEVTANYALSDADMKQYKEWRDTAMKNQPAIDAKYRELLVSTVNDNPAVQAAFGSQKFSAEELTNAEKGLADTDWLSMWTMDITHGIFSENGLLPQVAFSELSKKFNERLVKIRDYNERIDNVNPKVIAKLKAFNHTLFSKGITDIEGVSYQMFKEITKDGNETNGLVQRFIKEYADMVSNRRYSFDQDLKGAVGNAAWNKAFEKQKAWRRQNQIIMDITKIPEIASEPEFAEFNAVGDATYRQSLIDILGQRGYDEHVKGQRVLLRKYQSERENIIQELLVTRGKPDYASLAPSDKANVEMWDIRHNPLKGHEDYYNATGIYLQQGQSKIRENSYMMYNMFIPRKNKVDVKLDIPNDSVTITDLPQETGYYSKVFDEIERDVDLLEFYDLLKEGAELFRDNMPANLQLKIPSYTLPGMKKSSSEIILDKNINVLRRVFPAFSTMWDKVRTSFGVTEQSNISHASIDITTGQPNYKINDAFFEDNSNQVHERMLIEKTKFMQAFNAGIADPTKHITEIKRFTSLNLNRFDESTLMLLAEYIHSDITLAEVRVGNLDKITNRLPYIVDQTTNKRSYLVEIGKYIRDYSVHTIVQSQSYDLAKVMKYYHGLAQTYAAKQEALPAIKIIKKFYEGIRKPVTNNTGVQMENAKDNNAPIQSGLRERGNAQFDSWFNRVILGNTGEKHYGVIGSPDETSIFSKKIYSKEDKAKYKELTELMDKEPSDTKRAELRKIRDRLGKTRTITAALNNFLEWIKVLRLGYSMSSMTTNFIEGWVSNMMISSTNEYFDPKELYFGYSTVKHSFLKNISFGHVETKTGRKVRSLMDRHNVVIDSSNENQRSSQKTITDKIAWMNPHAGNQRVEFINQAPIMVAMLRTVKIKDTAGNESSVWDALDDRGHLLPQFDVGDNKRNWELLEGNDYTLYKQKLNDVIVKAHGNYDVLRGMMIKEGTFGKALMMFKTWIPQQLMWRFGAEQYDIATGNKKFKGKYRSHTLATGALHGAVAGFAMFGVPGALIGIGIGGIAAGIKGAKSPHGTLNPVGFLMETVEATRLLLKKALGMPLNTLTGLTIGKQVFDPNKKWIGKGEYFDNWKRTSTFTEQDANNLRSNMTDIAILLDFIIAMLLVKAFFYDDDDEEETDKPWHKPVHNILINRLMTLSAQASSYVNPNALLHSTFGSMAAVQYLEQLGKEMVALERLFSGHDRIGSGVNAGESGAWNQTKKILLPGIFKDGPFDPIIDIVKGKVPMLGFESQSERQFEKSPYDDWFKSDKHLDKETIKGKRAELKDRLMLEYKKDYPDDPDELKKAVNKAVNEELPTTRKLEKLNMSREEYNKSKQ